MSNHANQHYLAPAGHAKVDPAAANTDYGHIAPDCAGLNFYEIDKSFQASLRVHMPPEVLRHFEPMLKRLEAVAGIELDYLARIVDQNPPVLEQGDPRKLLVSRFVPEHRLETVDPLAPADGAWERAAYEALLQEECGVSLANAVQLVSA